MDNSQYNDAICESSVKLLRIQSLNIGAPNLGYSPLVVVHCPLPLVVVHCPLHTDALHRGLILTMQLLLVIHALVALHPLVLAAHKMSRQIKRILPSLAFICLVGKDFCRQQNYRCDCKLFSPIQFQNTRMLCNLRKKSWMLNCGHATRRSSNLRMPIDVPAELKKVVISIAKLSYDIFSKGTTMQPEQIKNVIIAAATKLLKTGNYLRIPDSSNGKFMNFVSQALKDVCLEFFYSNSKKALKNTDDFQQTIPINALILVAAVVHYLKGVITGFSKTSSNKVPELTADRCRTNFNKLKKSVNKLLDILERCEGLKEMLELWAKIGMGGSDWHADGSDAGSDTGDINIILGDLAVGSNICFFTHLNTFKTANIQEKIHAGKAKYDTAQAALVALTPAMTWQYNYQQGQHTFVYTAQTFVCPAQTLVYPAQTLVYPVQTFVYPAQLMIRNIHVKVSRGNIIYVILDISHF
ncbi:hypothetical protein BDR03DRAFT_983734 [Suillus americanus]|nr:hypothetical protein BDR03DRAFT_983734 [Suillus americanus]